VVSETDEVPAGLHVATRRDRRRWLFPLLTVALGAVVIGMAAYGWPSSPPQSTKHSTLTANEQRTTTTAPAPSTTVPPVKTVPPGPPTDQRRMVSVNVIGGAISPKSVDASGTGLIVAQNMMYHHSVTVYNSTGDLVRTIPDSVDLSQFGYPDHPGLSRGAPVEAAFSPDARYVYVSNYSMYGQGFGPEGVDTCTPSSARSAGVSNSYVYRIDTSTLAIDRVIAVGMVPKYVAVSPDNKYVLVSNWCSYDLSVIDVATAKEVARLPIGAFPRGIAVAPDSSVAYVATMGGSQVTKIDLRTLSKTGSFYVGSNPRHLVMDPAGRYLYVSLNGSGTAVQVDLTTQRVVRSVHTGADERSMAISADGLSLYVVNYLSNTVTKLRASDLAVLQTVPTGVHPIGVTYDRQNGNVWVAVYSGQILVYAER
jgi:YVTN family beta-propeller protein